MTDLASKRVLITGGSRGIGFHMATRFASLGAHVILWARDERRLAGAARRIAAAGGSVEHCVVDVADRSAVEQAAEALVKRGGPIHVLVNNAGVLAGRPLLELRHEDIEQTFRVNVLAHFWTLRAFLPAMIAADAGHIVTVASAAALCAVPRLADYSATKSAAFALDEALRLELKRALSNVQTTVVCPFYVDTEMVVGVKTRFPLLLPILGPQDVADRVVAAVLKNRRRVMMPRVVAVTWLARLLPVAWFDAIASWLGIARSMDTFVGHRPTTPSLPRLATDGEGIQASRA